MSRIIPIIPISVPPLRMVVVEVTTWCNLKCAGCNRTIDEALGTWRNAHMTFDTFERVVTNLPPAEQIVMHGVGEPMLNPQYLEMIRSAHASGKFKNIICITNALARDVEYYEALIRAGLSSFTVSVDSLTQEIADLTRAGTQVTKLKERLAEFKARGLPFSVSAVASRLNRHDLVATIRQLDEIGVDTVHIQPYIEFDERKLALSADEMAALDASLREVQAGLATTRINMPLLAGMMDTTTHGPCAAPWREPGVTVDGFLAPCCVEMNPAPLGHIDLKTTSFAAAQDSAGYRRFLHAYAEHSPSFCSGCFNNHRDGRTLPLVSLTMVTYNQAPYVREALRAVLAQTWSPLEIIISDDASTDGTPEIIEECLAAYTGPHHVRFLRQPSNLGARGRNNFLATYRHANGDFIVWSCGDDLIAPTLVERMVEIWQREGKSLITTNAEYIDAESRPLGRFLRDPEAEPNVSVDNLARDGANDCNFGAGMGFAREMIDVFGFDEQTPPPSLAPDMVFPFYAGLLGGCAMIREPLMKYRMHQGQTSGSAAHESAGNHVQRLSIEKEIWIGHISAANHMAETLERVSASDPQRFGATREHLTPLLDHQLELMRGRLVAVMHELDVIGYPERPPAIAAPPVPAPQQVLDEAIRLLRENNDLSGAAQLCYTALETFPQHAQFPYLLALIMRSSGELDVAHELLQAALAIEPANATFRNELRAVEAELAPPAAPAARTDIMPVPPEPPAPDLNVLSTAPAVTVYFIDLSDECNLRCTYCHQTAPGFKGRPMAAQTIEQLREMLRQHPPRTSAFLSSGGETTTLQDWTRYVDEFVALDIPCSIISNFARAFSAKETATLSRLTEIMVSIDSVDPQITKDIRRKSDIKTILYNIGQIKAHCALSGLTSPRIVWNVVSYDQSLARAASLAAAAVAYRADQVTFAQIKTIPGVGYEGVRMIRDLDAAARAACARELTRALDLLATHGIPASVNEELQIELGLAPAALATQYTEAERGHLTRNCLMPWEMFLTHSDGSVKPCCNAEGVTIGRIEPGQDPFVTVFNGPDMRTWRQSMLTGELSDACKTCTSYPLVDCNTLIQRVKHHFHH